MRFWAELESLGDCEANGEDPCQTGEQEAELRRYVPTLGAREGRKMKID